MSDSDTMIGNDDAGAGEPAVEEYLPLKPDIYLILIILADGASHGYGIIKEADERSAGRVRLQAGSLYRRLKWMLEQGLIQEPDPEEIGDDPAAGEGTDERRRIYGITERGRSLVAAEARRMAELVEAARSRRLFGEAGKI